MESLKIIIIFKVSLFVFGHIAEKNFMALQMGTFHPIIAMMNIKKCDRNIQFKIHYYSSESTESNYTSTQLIIFETNNSCRSFEIHHLATLYFNRNMLSWNRNLFYYQKKNTNQWPAHLRKQYPYSFLHYLFLHQQTP